MNRRIKKVLLTSEDAISNNSDEIDGNTDVIVFMDNGKKYIASFFSYSFLDKINYEHQMNGELLNGSYFWDKNMVLVKNCSLNIIEPVIIDLIDEGNFQEAFRELQ